MRKLNVSMDMFGNAKEKQKQKQKKKRKKEKRNRKCYYEVFKSKLASKHRPCLLAYFFLYSFFLSFVFFVSFILSFVFFVFFVSFILSFFLLFSLFWSKYLFFDTMAWNPIYSRCYRGVWYEVSLYKKLKSSIIWKLL